MHVALRLAPALLLCLAASSAAWAKGSGTKPKPAPKPKLPAGLSLWADGRNYALSRDGKLLAYARWTPDPKNVDYHAQPIPKVQVFVRTLATKKDVEVRGAKGAPVGWTNAGGLGLTTGQVVDPATGKPVPGTATMPAGTPVEALAWTRDGTRLVYAPDWTATIPPQAGIPQVLTEVDAAGKARPLDFGDKVYTGEGGTLAWSPDGKLVAYDIPFFEMGQVPPRRVGFIDTGAQPKIKDVAEFSQDNGIPGHQETRRPMRPHPGTTGPILGPCVWDDASTLLVYVSATGGGKADLHLWDVAAGSSRAITKDGATKWSPAMAPSGKHVAFLTGKVEVWPEDTNQHTATLFPPLPKVDGATLRVLDIAGGTTTDYAVPGEPAYPGNVTWSPDGTTVLYEIHTGNAEGVYAQVVATAPAAPAPGGAGK